MCGNIMRFYRKWTGTNVEMNKHVSCPEPAIITIRSHSLGPLIRNIFVNVHTQQSMHYNSREAKKAQHRLNVKSLECCGCCRQGNPSAVIKNETCESSLMWFAYASSNCSDLGDGRCLRWCCFYANQCDWRQAGGLTGPKNKDHQISL